MMPHCPFMRTKPGARFLMLFFLAILPACAGRIPLSPDAADQPFDPGYTAWKTLLARQTVSGGVDYPAIHQNDEYLEAALNNFQRVSADQFESWPHDEQLAFLINAHNAFAIRRLVAHWPTESLDATALIFSPRTRRDIVLLGRRWSLMDLYEAVMGERYAESRAIFLLNWGEAGCAPLARAPVTGANLEDQLERQARRVLADPDYVQYDVKNHLIRVTPLIKWNWDEFRRDFTTLWIFLERYLPDAQAQTLARRPPRIRFLDWDESLNVIPPAANQIE